MSDEELTWYRELNERARAYSNQLWYVPFAYVGLVGLGVSQVVGLQGSLEGFGFLALALFSMAVLVHVTGVKFYQRSTIVAMRELENPASSKGFSAPFLSSAWWMRWLLFLASLVFTWYGLRQLEFPRVASVVILAGVATVAAVVVGLDWKRTKDLHKRYKKQAR